MKIVRSINVILHISWHRPSLVRKSTPETWWAFLNNLLFCSCVLVKLCTFILLRTRVFAFLGFKKAWCHSLHQCRPHSFSDTWSSPSFSSWIRSFWRTLGDKIRSLMNAAPDLLKRVSTLCLYEHFINFRPTLLRTLVKSWKRIHF